MPDAAVSPNSPGRSREMWFRQVVMGPWLKRARPAIRLAAWLWRRLLFRTTFIAITGSVGKTTAKELLAAILKQQGRTYKTIANQNGPNFTALNVLRVRPWHKYAVLEAGVAEPGAMARSAALIKPDVTMVLAMRRTHTTAFATLEDHAAEKAVLVRATHPSGGVVLLEDDPLVAPMADGGPWRILRFGVSTSASLRASNVSALWPQRLCFEIEHAGRTIPVRTQFVGEHWLPSVLGPIAVAHALGVPLDAAARAVAAVPPYPGRMQPVRLPNGAVFLRDDYNGSLDTLEAAFDVFRGAKATRRILVISDIADFGGHIRKRMAYLGQKAGEACDLLVLIGDYPDRAVKRAFVSGLTEERTRRFFSLEQAAKFLRAELRDGDLVLLKGRTTDHVSRIFFAQLGTVSCWKAYCPKTMLCDECWELGPHSR